MVFLQYGCWPVTTRLTLPPFKNKILQQKIFITILRLSGKWPTVLHCFHTCDRKCTYEDTAVQPAQWFLLALQFVRPKSCKSFFVLTKHVNAVSQKLHWAVCWKKMPLTLHENFAEISAGYLFSSLTFFYKRCIVVLPKILIGSSVQCNLIAYCAQCKAYFALCAQKKKRAIF